MEAAALFEGALRWLQRSYSAHRFFTERDIVWTLQLRMLQEVAEAGLTHRVFNDHTISGRTRTDLAILDGDSVAVAAEFKYEPSHTRRADQGGDIWPSKFDVVSWTGDGSVEEDIRRVRDYVERSNAQQAFSIFIDEGGRFRHRNPYPGSEWLDWGQGVWVLRSAAKQ